MDESLPDIPRVFIDCDRAPNDKDWRDLRLFLEPRDRDLRADEDCGYIEHFVKYHDVISLPDEGVYILVSSFALDMRDSLFKGVDWALHNITDSRFKIGFSDSIRQRINKFMCGSAFGIRLVHVIETDDMEWCETWIHQRLNSARIRSNNEWFVLNSLALNVLMSLDELNRPRSVKDQRHLLDLHEKLMSALAPSCDFGLFGDQP